MKKSLFTIIAICALLLFTGLLFWNQEDTQSQEIDSFQIVSLETGMNPFFTQYFVTNGQLLLTKTWTGEELSSEQEKMFLTTLAEIFEIENPELPYSGGHHYRSNIPVSARKDDYGITLNFLNTSRRFSFTQGSQTRVIDENGVEYNFIIAD